MELEEVAQLPGAGVHGVDVEHGGLRPHHVLLDEGPHLVPRLTVSPHQALASVLLISDLKLKFSVNQLCFDKSRS